MCSSTWSCSGYSCRAYHFLSFHPWELPCPTYEGCEHSLTVYHLPSQICLVNTQCFVPQTLMGGPEAEAQCPTLRSLGFESYQYQDFVVFTCRVHLLCASAVKDSRLRQPPLSSGVLLGLLRKELLFVTAGRSDPRARAWQWDFSDVGGALQKARHTRVYIRALQGRLQRGVQT